jgi:hypothetical protein
MQLQLRVLSYSHVALTQPTGRWEGHGHAAVFLKNLASESAAVAQLRGQASWLCIARSSIKRQRWQGRLLPARGRSGTPCPGLQNDARRQCTGSGVYMERLPSSAVAPSTPRTSAQRRRMRDAAQPLVAKRTYHRAQAQAGTARAHHGPSGEPHQTRMHTSRRDHAAAKRWGVALARGPSPVRALALAMV